MFSADSHDLYNFVDHLKNVVAGTKCGAVCEAGIGENNRMALKIARELRPTFDTPLTKENLETALVGMLDGLLSLSVLHFKMDRLFVVSW